MASHNTDFNLLDLAFIKPNHQPPSWSYTDR